MMTVLFTKEERVAAGRRYASGIDFTLQLPGNTKFIAAADIPGLIAKAIHPADMADDKAEVVSLHQLKDESIERSKLHRELGWKGDIPKVAGEVLPDDVIELMNARCAPLPKIRLPMPKAQWQKYADALAANADTPKIEYTTSVRDTKVVRKAIREGVEWDYRQQLYLAVYSGELPVVTSDTYLTLRVEPPPHHDNANSRERWLSGAFRDERRSLDRYQMRLDDFVTFAATLGIEVFTEGRNEPDVTMGWPWGSHETELLKHLAAAAQRFWRLYDPSDATTAPTNKDVSTWLESRGVSQRVAENMATILRPDALPTGPRK